MEKRKTAPEGTVDKRTPGYGARYGITMTVL